MTAVAQGRARTLRHPGRRLLFLALAALAAALLGMAFVMALPDRPPKTQFGVGAVDDFEIGSVTTIPEGRFHVVRTTSDEFIALSWRNPGQSHCTVPWNRTSEWPDASGDLAHGWFRDPCTGSTFDKSGHRVFGPATRDMDRYPVTIVAGEVTVDSHHYVCGFSPPYVTNCAPPTGSP